MPPMSDDPERTLDALVVVGLQMSARGGNRMGQGVLPSGRLAKQEPRRLIRLSALDSSIDSGQPLVGQRRRLRRHRRRPRQGARRTA